MVHALPIDWRKDRRVEANQEGSTKVRSKRTGQDHSEKEETTMVGAVFLAFVAVSLLVGAVALLVWWLSRLWRQHEEAAAVPAIEIKAEPSAAPLEPPEADVEVMDTQVEAEAPTEEAELPEVEAEVVAVETDAPVEEVEVAAAQEEVETQAVEPEVEEPDVEVTPDDLTRIEGIGPKIASVLQAAGILTYEQLADSDPEELRKILEDSDPRLLRIAHPDTWPEQARFAAAGDWEGHSELTSGLKGGRRV
jgi:predicted flap endonuclease-1-like 5' DNA nuclease